jgi:glycosyltransferase involved in cell wall biosynthesis
MWNNKKISIIFSTYNEKDSIKKAINDMYATGVVDEVIVINNNAAKGTDFEVITSKNYKTSQTKLFYEKKQGYGWGYRRGLVEATGDILIMSEPDGTFVAKDIHKLLEYSKDFDIVFGTRTTGATIGRDANMGLFLKWGNWFVAKLMEILFSTTHLSDAGCTMKLIKRKSYNIIKKDFTTGDSYFGLELMLITIHHKIQFIEIPVHYIKRVGESSVTGSFHKAFKLGIQMIIKILAYRIKTWIKGGKK